MLNRNIAVVTACFSVCAALSGTAQAQLLSDGSSTGAVSNGCFVTVSLPDYAKKGPDRPDGVDLLLWPPNHKLHTVQIEAENENGEACDVNIVTVTQDEAVDALGSGNTTGADADNCDNSGDIAYVDLRAERAGTLGDTNGDGTSDGGMGTGRFYRVTFSTENPQDGSASEDYAIVLVPHDRRSKPNWIDEQVNDQVFTSNPTMMCSQ